MLIIARNCLRRLQDLGRYEITDDPLFPATSPILKPLGLTQEECDDLIAFLETL
jgi:hypothetical protein